MLRFIEKAQILQTSQEFTPSWIWGLNADPLTNVLDIYVGRLRRKTGAESERIVTLRNVGHRTNLANQ
jgi:DNA-binding response OmpR family regulator